MVVVQKRGPQYRYQIQQSRLWMGTTEKIRAIWGNISIPVFNLHSRNCIPNDPSFCKGPVEELLHQPPWVKEGSIFEISGATILVDQIQAFLYRVLGLEFRVQGLGVWGLRRAPCLKGPADAHLRGLLLRNLNQVTILGKPYYLLYIPIMVT